MQVEVEFKTIDSTGALESRKQDIEFLLHFFPYDASLEGVEQLALDGPANLVVVRANGVPIGMFLLILYKRSAELHGVFRPDINEFIYGGGLLKNKLVADVFRYVFEDEGKKVLIMKARPGNKGVRGLRLIWGFEQLQNLDKGRVVYKLTSEQYKKAKEQRGL